MEMIFQCVLQVCRGDHFVGAGLHMHVARKVADATKTPFPQGNSKCKLMGITGKVKTRGMKRCT